MTALYFMLATMLLAVAATSLRGSRFPAYGRWLSVLVLLYGLLVKPLFIALALPSEDFISAFILGPLSSAEYWSGSVLLLGAYTLFVGAMISTSQLLRRQRPVTRPPRALQFHVGHCWGMAAVGLLGMVAFFSQNLDLLTGASKNILAKEDLADYSASGGLRLLISILYFIPFLMLVNLSAGYRLRASRRLLWTAALMWTAFGFFSDQRGVIVFSVLSWLIGYRSFVGKINAKRLVTVGVIALGMMFVRTVLRLANDDGGLQVLADEVIGNYIGRNLVENAKTLIILRSIPEQLAYGIGASYLDSLLILVPRSLFAAKQTVNLDTVIGMAVFGCNVFGACGVPPGVVAESYYNFGVLGVPILMLACGALTAWLDYKASRGGTLYRIFYAATLVYFGVSVLGSSISSFATQAVTDAIVLLFVCNFAMRRRRRAPTQSPPQALAPSS